MSDPKPVTDSQFWNRHWKARESVSRLKESHPFFGKNGAFLQMIHAQAGSLQGRAVLELGGGGNNRRLLAMAKWGGASVTVVDFSDESLRILRSLFELNGVPVETLVGDFFDTTLYARKYDVVVHWGVLEHFGNPSELLGLSRDLLTAEGTIVVGMPNLEGLARYAWMRWSPDLWSKHILHTNKELVECCEDLQLSVIDAFYFGRPFLALDRVEVAGLLPAFAVIVQKCALGAALVIRPLNRVHSKCLAGERFLTIRKQSAGVLAHDRNGLRARR